MAATIPALDDVPGDRLAYLRRLEAEKERRDIERLKSLDVFKLIGYEPNCRRRYVVRKRAADKMGIENPFDWRVTEAVEGKLPQLCGQCPQEQFHSATEDAVLYGGASGGGKSYAITAEGIRACARYPGLRVLLVRCSYDELEESIFPALRKFSYAEALEARWNSVKRELRFPNGSVFRFRYLETLDDASKRQGGEYQLLLVDEMTLMVPGVVDILRYERLRAAGGLPVIGMRATSNPGGPSHGEVKAGFVEATEYGRKIIRDEHGLTVRFIQAKATDNPHLDPAHKRRLDAIPDPARRAAMRDGDWDQWSGMIFKEWRAERHTIEPVALPPTLSRYCGVDWGFAKPWAVLWGALEDGRLWIYRELYATGVGESDQAAQILAAEEAGERVFARWADDSMWATRGESLPLATVYAQNGVALTPAGKGPGSRVQGWQRIHSYMKEAPACPHHRAQGWETCPNLHIFTTCSNLIFEIKNLPHATTGNPEDADPKAVDHAADALRYLTINLGGGATFYESPEPGRPLGTPAPLAPMGRFAVAEDAAGAPKRAEGSKPNPRQGAVQTWEEALASMNR